MRQSFPHLHVASAYSPHYGVTMPEAIVYQAAAAGADFIALTDRDGLYGAVKHVRAHLQETLQHTGMLERAVVEKALTEYWEREVMDAR